MPLNIYTAVINHLSFYRQDRESGGKCAALRQINVDGRFLDYIMVCTIHIIGRRKRDESTTRIGWPLHRF